MRICFIPIDNRPVCYNMAKDICAIDEDIELFIPPRELLGDLTKTAKVDELFLWLKSIKEVDTFVVSLDTLIYGGLIPSRREVYACGELENRLSKLKDIIQGKKVYAFSSIMRISNNNYNEEEKEYWKDWGKAIFKYSFTNARENYGIPKEILEDYLDTRKRNFEINKKLLKMQKDGLFDTLIFSKDDCATRGFNVNEAKELENLGGKTKTGADEIPLTLLARAINKSISVYPVFTEPEYKDYVSNYEDVSILDSVLGQLELGGFKIAKSEEEADVVLLVNNFIEKQGELVMGWETSELNKKIKFPTKPYAIADVRFANGADNEFVHQLLENFNLDNFYGYAGWNTSANTLGSLLACVKVKYKAKKYNDLVFKKLQAIRFLDDWAYQANVRCMITQPCDIKSLMKPFEDKIKDLLNLDFKETSYSYPWNRKFEIEVNTTISKHNIYYDSINT